MIRGVVRRLHSSAGFQVSDRPEKELTGFMYSMFTILREKHASSCYKCSKCELVREVDEEDEDYLEEAGDELMLIVYILQTSFIHRSWIKKSNTHYAVHIAPPISVVNCLPLPIKYLVRSEESTEQSYSRCILS